MKDYIIFVILHVLYILGSFLVNLLENHAFVLSSEDVGTGLRSGMHDDLNLTHLLACSQKISGRLCKQPASKRSLH